MVATVPLKAWARVFAFAWHNENVLENLRKDPKGTIEELAKGEDGPYKADPTTAYQAGILISQSEDPSESYSGYLPLPFPVAGLDNLNPTQIKQLLESGATGTIKFSEEAELWAEVFYKAWNDLELLKNIRKDPLANLPNVDKLKASEYGVFPIPSRPRGLENLSIEQLEEFLGDQDNARHLAGFMATVS